MAHDRRKPAGEQFTELDGRSFEQTLIPRLTPLTDRLRDLKTRLGSRAYQVFLVRTRWSGGRRGVGTEEVIQEEPILPTPAITGYEAVSLEQLQIGIEEVGGITLKEVSPRYTEDELIGLGPSGEQIPKDQQFYYEIRLPQARENAARRRFIPDGPPKYETTKFQWSVPLRRAQEDRARGVGTPLG